MTHLKSHTLEWIGNMEMTPDFVQSLNRMWLDYVRPIAEANSQGLPFEVVKSLDWHGAKVNVVSARNPRLVGVQGIVFAMTELQLWVIDSNQKKWRVDKDGTEIEMIIDDRNMSLSLSLCFEEDIKVGKTLQRKRSRHITKMKKKRDA